MDRKYYGNHRLLDSSPSSLTNALSPTDESNSCASADESERSDLSLFSGILSLFSGMDASITEEPDEEE